MNFFSRLLLPVTMALALSLSAGVIKTFAQNAEEGGDSATMSEAEKQWRSVQWEGSGTDARLGDEASVKVP